RLYSNPAEAADLYTRQCSLEVCAKDLAVMGATLADGGMNPVTRQHVVSPEVCHYALAAMATAGLYETSGDWLYDIGLPGKSGIAEGSGPVRQAKADSEHSRRRPAALETASRDSWLRSSCHSNLAWTCSCRNQRSESGLHSSRWSARLGRALRRDARSRAATA